MKILMIFSALVVLSSAIYSQTAPEWLWAKQVGGTSFNEGRAIAVDSDGNSYITGCFVETITFGDITLISNGNYDIFITKLDSNGNYLWAVKAGSTSYDQGNGIALDSSGNCYITGCFSGTANFGTIPLTSSGSNDIFVAKVDSIGNYIWAKKAGGTGHDDAYSISIDANGNSYVTGYFEGSAQFGTTNLSSFGFVDVFIAKIDSNGENTWTVKVGGVGNDQGLSITSNSGNIYVTGFFTGISTFGESTLHANGGIQDIDVFVVKLDTDGIWQWARKAGGTNDEISYSIDIDSNGMSYITGYFSGNIYFGASELYSSRQDIFVAKLDNNGDWLWASKAGGSGSNNGLGIALDSYDSAFITGYMSGTTSFGSHTIINDGSVDAFVAKIDTDGNWLWANIARGVGNDRGQSVAIDTDSNCYITGNFEETVSFGLIMLTSSGHDIFIAKISKSLPSADFSANTTEGYEPISVIFTDQSISGSGNITDWLWDFGDGDTSTLQSPIHVYNCSGIYSVTLTVTNSNDATSSLTKHDYITVLPRIPELEIVSDTPLHFGNVYLGSISTIQEVWLKNIGSADLTIDAISHMLSSTPFSLIGFSRPLTIAEGDSSAIQICFIPQQAGSVIDSLFLNNNSSNMPIAAIRLSGKGVIVPPKPPENVHIAINGINAVLSWDAVTQTIFNTPINPDYYFVFNSSSPYGGFTFHGATNGLQYTQFMVGAFQPWMFYKVLAYKHFGRGEPDINALGLVPGLPEEEVLRLLN